MRRIAFVTAWVPWRAAAVVWVVLASAQSLAAAAPWLDVVPRWRDAPWADLPGPGLLAAPFRHAWSFLFAGAVGCACAGLGGVAARWLPPVRGRPWERRALRVLHGFALLGLFIFAAGLCGLAFGPGLWAAALAALVLAGARDLAGAAFRGRLPRPPPGWTPWLAAVAAAALPGMLLALAPDVHVDVLTYHLAVPELMLRLHRFPSLATTVQHQSPLAAECVAALAVAADRDALAHVLVALPWAAGAALLAGRAAAWDGAGAGWAAGALLLTFGLASRTLSLAKSDLAAAGYGAALAVAVARGLGGSRGWLAASALLAGAGASVKFNGHALAAVALAGVLLARPRRAAGWAAIAALPALPWMAKSWLLFADPLWPVLSGWWPGALWDLESQAAVVSLRDATLPVPLAAAGGAAGALARGSPVLLLALPWALRGLPRLPAEARRVAAFAGASALALYAAIESQAGRLALPCCWAAWAAVAAAAVVPAAAAWRPPVRWVAAAATVLGAWLPVGELLGDSAHAPADLAYLAGARTQAAHLAARMSTLHAAGEALRALPPPHRAILLGDIRGYRLPGRILTARHPGRTWAWVLARECRDPGEIRRKFRQLGCRYVLYNLVTDAFPHSYARPFRWDDRMLALWRTFVGRHLEIAVPPERVDHENGAFVIYALRGDPLNRDPPWLPYLPGVESLYEEVTRHGLTQDVDGWLAAAHALARRLPRVDFVSDFVGLGYRLQERWREAERWYRPGIAHGTVNDNNYWDMAVCLAGQGRLEEAWPILKRAVQIAPSLAERAAVLEAAMLQIARLRGKT